MSLISNLASEEPGASGYSSSGTIIPSPKRSGREWLYEAGFLLDSVTDAIISTDLDHRIKSWNKAAEELFGLKEREAIDQPVSTALLYSFLTDSREIAWEKVNTEGKWKGEVLYKGLDGKEIYLEISSSRIQDPEGRTVGYASIYRDTTDMHLMKKERKAVAEQMSTRERIFRSFMENTPTLTWILDDKGCFRYMNSFYMKAFGLSADAIGRSIYEFFPAEFCDSYITANQLVWESNSPMEFTEKGITADGNTVILQVYKFPLGVENGTRLLGGTALDITQVIQTREELIRSNERYNYAGKATSDAIWDWKIGEDKIYRGEGFKSLFGYQEDISSFDLELEHIHPEDRERVKSSLDMALKGKDDHWQLEYRFQCLDGSYRTIMDKAYILRSPALAAVRVIGAMHDITDQRNLEKMLVEEEVRKKRELIKAIMEAQEKERREISAELHDNVNQILTTCKLFLEIARNNPANARFIDGCYTNIQNVIQEIRNISHNLTPYTLKDLGLVAAMHDLAGKINQSGKITIRLLSFQRLEEDRISPDIKLALFRIVQEKISNVLKHSHATELKIEITVVGKRLRMILTDNGQGFDEKAVKKGLGLNNIHNRVEYYKGTMFLKTAPGKGCELRIELPCA